ncbi:MAG TPA: hypothetical protein VF129_11030 [Actinomycetota bacterium]
MLNGDIQMLAGELSHHRVAELRREADSDRLARGARGSRVARSRGTVKRLAQAALAAATWPIRR